MKSLTRIRLSIILFAILMLTFVSFVFVYPFIIVPRIGGFNKTTILIYIFLMAGMFAFQIVLFFLLFRYTNEHKAYVREEQYNFGEYLSFSELNSNSRALNGILKNPEGKIISFTTSTSELAIEAFETKQNKIMCGSIARYIKTYFDGKIFKRKLVYYYFEKNRFVIALSSTEEECMKICHDIENEVFNIVKAKDIRLFIQPFFGIAQVEPKLSMYDNINNADVARKVGEKNFDSIVVYDEKKITKGTTEDEINQIMSALSNNEFVVYYQPKFNLITKQFEGSEALIRWNSPTRGLISPSRFINFAEQTGIIHELDMFVLEQVCKDILDQKRRGKRILPVSVNFSLYEFYKPGFLDDIENILLKYKIEPNFIQIEITEETSPANSFVVASSLRKLKDMGLKILLDDFGMGFSNLNNLKKLPVDIIKIDKSFVDDIVASSDAKAVIKTLIDFSHSLHLKVIAEGVDDKKQVEILKRYDCDVIQGYYYSRPIPKKDFEKFLIENEFEKRENK